MSALDFARYAFVWCARLVCASLGFCALALSAPQQEFQADVVLVIDTSVSMREKGMDPHRVSLLAAKLFSDVVPGKLAVIRLLDLVDDKKDIPMAPTGKKQPCKENPAQNCDIVGILPETWDQIRRAKTGALIRPQRGSTDFKNQLNAHLEQKSNNSDFGFAFLAALGVYDENAKTVANSARTLVWLSDGLAEDPAESLTLLHELANTGVRVEPMIFGRGDTTLAAQAGLQPHRVSNPAQLMSAFADAFRRVVQAPYRIDGSVRGKPSFEIKPHIDEAWVVVHGDNSLGNASVTGPSGNVLADYAQDSYPGAGAYRVAHINKPAAGQWSVKAAGGGNDVAYAVVQRSKLIPTLLEPKQAVLGVPSKLVIALTAGPGGPIVRSSEVSETVEVKLESEGQLQTFRDDGVNGDDEAGDGRYTSHVSFGASGQIPVKILAKSSFIDRVGDDNVMVSGTFQYAGGPVDVDFGVVQSGHESCRSLGITADHQGKVPFTIELLKELPSGHSIELRTGGRRAAVAEALPLEPHDQKQICLVVGRRAGSSGAMGELWAHFKVMGSNAANNAVPLNFRWQVHGLTFWQLWGWLILLIAGLLLIVFIVMGFILPKRFQRELAITYVLDRIDIDEQSPQPLSQWKGVRIGFYRDARAFLQSDFRINGVEKGAVAKLQAAGRGGIVFPGKGLSLFWERGMNDWEPVSFEGRRYHLGDVYRIGDRGPFFRISARVSR